MAVRKTESRIPSGFAKAGELGEAVYSDDGNYVIISYLSAPLRADPELLKLKNKYVVFVNTNIVGAPDSYEWELHFFSDDPDNPIYTTPKISTVNGVFSLDVGEVPEVFDASLTRVVVTVTLDGVGNPLVMDQIVEPLLANIEELILDDAEGSVARGGNPPVTRAIANRYSQYLLGSESQDPKTGVPPNLVAAILYLIFAAIPDEVQALQIKDWEEDVNLELDGLIVSFESLGITQLIPYIVAMFVNGEGITPGVVDLQAWKTEDEDYSAFQKRVVSNFYSVIPRNAPVSSTQRSDFVNLLRFPKSAIKVIRITLDACLAQHPNWMALSRDNLTKNRTAIETITSEYTVGLFEGEPVFTPLGKSVFNKMFSPYIQTIINSNYEHFFLPDAAPGEVVDIDTTTLQLHLVRTLEEVENVVGDEFDILFSVYIKHAKKDFNYEIFQLSGKVRTISGIRKLTFQEGVRPSLDQEPGWPATPLFGRKAKFSALDTNGIPFEGANEIDLWIPTLRYVEMWDSYNKTAAELAINPPDEEQLLLQFGCKVNDVLEKPPVQVKIRWKTMKQTIDERIAQAINENANYGSLNYEINPSLLDGNSDGNNSSHHVEQIVLHSISRWPWACPGEAPNLAIFGDFNQFFSSNPNSLFNLQYCLDALNNGGVGAHYILGRDGHLIELRRPCLKTWHAVEHNPTVNIPGNTRSIGIEIVGIDDERRSSVVAAYEKYSVVNNADPPDLKTQKEAWTAAFSAFVLANGGDAISPTHPFDENNPFFNFTDQQYKALQILLQTLGERLGYIRICSHSWIDQRLMDAPACAVPPGTRRKTDPGLKFDFSIIEDSLVLGGPVQEDVNDGFVYMIDGKANGDSRR